MSSQNQYNACLLIRIPLAKMTTLSSGAIIWLCWILEAAPTNPSLHQLTVLILPCIKKKKNPRNHLCGLVRITLLPRELYEGKTPATHSQKLLCNISHNSSFNNKATKYLPYLSVPTVLWFSNLEKCSVIKRIWLQIFEWYWDYLTMDISSPHTDIPPYSQANNKNDNFAA